MKKIILISLLFITSVFGYNFNGTWTNTSPTSYNDPIRLKIYKNTITPYIKRGNNIAKLRAKKATNTGNGLFEAWGFRDKNLVIFAKPINSYKIKVIVKKINVTQRKITTKNFIFTNKSKLANTKAKKRYAGRWVNYNSFSAISRLQIRQKSGKIYVKAWRPTRFGEQYLGTAIASVKGSRLYINWRKNNIKVKANMIGLNFNKFQNRYNKLRLNLTAYNTRNGVSNSQTIYFRRSNTLPTIGRPIMKTIKVGPLDINIMTNSY